MEQFRNARKIPAAFKLRAAHIASFRLRVVLDEVERGIVLLVRRVVGDSVFPKKLADLLKVVAPVQVARECVFARTSVRIALYRGDAH